MPSPTWSAPVATPLFQALAAAQHAAWDVTPAHRRAVFTERFRQLVGPKLADELLLSALALFDVQASPPAGFVDPPANMHFACCPRCQLLNSKGFSQAPSGRVKLNALRDRDWLERRLANGGTAITIGKTLGCTPANVNLWIDRHGLERRRLMVHDDEVAALHDAGRAPGEISRTLDVPIDKVRGALKRVRGVTQKDGHHYFKKEWWVERIVTKQMTTRQAAADAGIYPHACSFWLKRFGLSHITAARSNRVTKERAHYKYPALRDPAVLKAAMDRIGTWEGVARELCGKANAAGNVKSWWLHHFGALPTSHRKRSPGTKNERSDIRWWTERLDRGLATWQIAEEAGLTEKTVREHLRVFGGDLLGRAYANNTKAEKAKRSIAAATKWARPAAPAEAAS